MRRSRSVHTVRLVLGLVAVSLSVLGAVRGASEVPTATAQSTVVVASHG
ncbi:MAG: hypothetical protein JWM10_268 [Myxococcaceae bacterium]|nr:hypothetical protein [Myxococcaceae bacterium]